MVDFPFGLYDTVSLGTTAAVTHTLFQVSTGGDSTHTKFYTNMRGSGALPVNEKLLIKSIHAVWVEQPSEADFEKMYKRNTLELFVSDESIFRLPLKIFTSHNSFGGTFKQAAAANSMVIGSQGWGHKLEPNVTLMGGDSFRVEVYQNEALATATDLVIILLGMLTR